MKSLIAAEIFKLRTVRAGWVLLGAVVAITALSVVTAVSGVSAGNQDLESTEGVKAVLHVAGSGALLVLMLGITITAGEYRHRTVVDTFLTTPKRSRVLVAKLFAALSTGVVYGIVATAVAVATAVIAYQIKGFSLPLGGAMVWQILIGSVVYAALFGGLGASIGSLIRNQMVAIIVTVVVLIIAEPMLIVLVPDVGRWLPAAMGRALVSDPGGIYQSPPVAGALLLLYVGAVMAIAAGIERRRDA